MGEEDIIEGLVSIFSSAKESCPNISLKFWYNNGQLGFFFCTNNQLRSRGERNLEPSSKNATLSPAGEKSVDLQTSSPIQTRQSKRKRKKVNTLQDSPEIHRDCDERQTSGHISTLNTSRNNTEISVPCQNSFEVLRELNTNDDGCCENEDDDEETSEDEDVDEEEGNDKDSDERILVSAEDKNSRGSNPICVDCKEAEVPHPSNHWCRDCFLKNWTFH